MDAADQKLEVIRKLLAKAERAATPQEADAYNTKAAEMMARHGLDAAIVAAAGGTERDVIGQRTIPMTDPYSTEKADLAGGIAFTMNCKAVRHLGPRGRRTHAVTIMGFESDLARVDVAFTSLLLQATASVTHQQPPSWGESTAAYRRSWLVGFTAEIVRRLNDANQRAVAQHDAETGGPSAALVVVDRRSQVSRAFDEAFRNTTKGGPRRLTGTGFAAGVAAGRRADVGHTRLRNEQRALG